MNGAGVTSTVGNGVGVRRGPGVSRPLGAGDGVHAHVEAIAAPGVAEAAAIGPPGTARMLATIHAVNRPPATARTSTTTATKSQPATPLDERRGAADGLPAGAAGGVAAAEELKSSDTVAE